jgi:chromate transport protein ChrA
MGMTNKLIPESDAVILKPVGLWELTLYFLRLGSSGFGGPKALAGYMQRDLIPNRRR